MGKKSDVDDRSSDKNNDAVGESIAHKRYYVVKEMLDKAIKKLGEDIGMEVG